MKTALDQALPSQLAGEHLVGWIPTVPHQSLFLQCGMNSFLRKKAPGLLGEKKKSTALGMQAIILEERFQFSPQERDSNHHRTRNLQHWGWGWGALRNHTKGSEW